MAVAAADGKKLSDYDLGTSPTFDGMAAAYGRLYLTTLDGKLLCLGDQGDPLPAAPAANLAPIDTAVKPLSSEPGTYTGLRWRAIFPPSCTPKCISRTWGITCWSEKAT